MSDRIAVMDGGRIVQVGAPYEIYDMPGSRFVAGFVGVSNLLELAVERVLDGVAHLRLADGDEIAVAVPSAAAKDGPGPSASGDYGRDADAARTASAAAGSVRTGSTAVLSIRPERIMLLDGGAPPAGACHARGTVTESLYAGPSTRHFVDLDGGGRLMVSVLNDGSTGQGGEHLQGRRVVLAWARESTRVIAFIDGQEAPT
jgi:ABC-type Fe3+/spermidine/putrescine transport system ATPase subunit